MKCIVAVLWLVVSSLFSQEVSDPAALANAARDQIGITTLYDPAYVSMTYPNGDVPEDRGVCTDVVIGECGKPIKSTFS